MPSVKTPLETPAEHETTRVLGSSVSAAGSLRAPSESPAVFLPGEIVARRFEILRFLGQGGMGQVFGARDLELGSTVALKVLRPEIAGKKSAVRRFKQEVQLARRVTHPNVCRIYDLVYHESTGAGGWGRRGRSTSILTMEMLEGETLAARLRRRGPFSPREALPLVAQMARALDAAHDQGVVHRDFKSANVLLVTEDGESAAALRAMVTDFGLAVTCRDDSRLRPRSVGVSGTPAYVAPELVEGGPATAASDVYSFGVVIYEMMTGRLPFQAETPEKTARLRVEEKPPPPSRHRPELDATWESAILRCLSRDPSRRFARAGDVVSALARLRRGTYARRLVLAAAVAALFVLVEPRRVMETPVRAVEARAGVTAQAVESRPSIAFLGFANISGDPGSDWIGSTLTEILTSELGPEASVVSRTEVERFRRGHAVPTAERFSEADFRRTHSRLDADYLVLGSYVAGSDRSLVVDVRSRHRGRGEEVTRIDRGRVEEIAEIGLRLAAGLRPHLGLEEPETDREATGRPSGFEAAELYEQGLAELGRFEPAKARELLEQAAVLEPEAPATLAALSEAWAFMGELARAEATARRAFELAGHLAWDERLRVEGRYREAVLDWTRAREIYQVLWKVFPESLDDGLRWVEVETRAGRPAEALARLEELRRSFDSSENPRLDFAEARAAQGRGLRQRQRSAAARAAAACEARGAELLASRARMLEAEALFDLGEREQALSLAEQARKTLAARGDRLYLAWTLITWDEAPVDLRPRDAIDLFREAGDRVGEARARIRQAWWKILQEKELDEVAETLGRVLETARKLADRETEAFALSRLAVLNFMRDDLHRTAQLFREATEAAEEGGNLRTQAGILGNYAGILSLLGELRNADEALEETLTLARRTGSRTVLVKTLMKSAASLELKGEITLAEERLLEAVRITRAIDNRGLFGAAARGLGTLYRNVDTARARLWLSRAVESFDPASGDAFLSDVSLAFLSIAEESYAEAETKLREMTAAYSPADDFTRFHLLLARASLLVGQRKFHEAEQTLGSLDPREITNVPNRQKVRCLGARIDAARGRVGEALAAARELVEEARARGDVVLGLEARMELARTLVESGDVASGRAELATVARHAREFGLAALADRADSRRGETGPGSYQRNF